MRRSKIHSKMNYLWKPKISTAWTRRRKLKWWRRCSSSKTSLQLKCSIATNTSAKFVIRRSVPPNSLSSISRINMKTDSYDRTTATSSRQRETTTALNLRELETTSSTNSYKTSLLSTVKVAKEISKERTRWTTILEIEVAMAVIMIIKAIIIIIEMAVDIEDPIASIVAASAATLTEEEEVDLEWCTAILEAVACREDRTIIWAVTTWWQVVQWMLMEIKVTVQLSSNASTSTMTTQHNLTAKDRELLAKMPQLPPKTTSSSSNNSNNSFSWSNTEVITIIRCRLKKRIVKSSPTTTSSDDVKLRIENIPLLNEIISLIELSWIRRHAKVQF